MRSRFFSFSTILLTALLFQVVSCKDESVTPQKGKVLLSLNIADEAAGNGRSKGLSDAKAVRVSIELHGNPVYQMKELTILHFGDDLVTEQLPLPVGVYTITELFVVDEGNNVLCAAPIKDSPGADLVSKPLPVEFTITLDHVSNIELEVLRVENVDADFLGYSVFNLEVKSVSALLLPAINKNVTRVTYIFSSGNSTTSEVIEGEGDIVNSILRLDDPRLLGKSWTARIYVWYEGMMADKYPLLYRFRGKINFNGSLTQLPPLDQEQWAHMMYREKMSEGALFKVLVTADPRDEQFHLELQMPPALRDATGFGVVDRGFWTPAGDELCTIQFEQVWQRYTPGIREATISGLPSPECVADNYVIDNMLHFRYGSEEIWFGNYFAWDIIDTIIQPPTTEPHDPQLANARPTRFSRSLGTEQ